MDLINHQLNLQKMIVDASNQKSNGISEKDNLYQFPFGMDMKIQSKVTLDPLNLLYSDLVELNTQFIMLIQSHLKIKLNIKLTLMLMEKSWFIVKLNQEKMLLFLC